MDRVFFFSRCRYAVQPNECCGEKRHHQWKCGFVEQGWIDLISLPADGCERCTQGCGDCAEVSGEHGSC
jgi:hypothetical protein